MINQKILDAIGNIDDNLIEEARSPKKQPNWKPWIAVAAAIAVLICSVFIPRFLNTPPKYTNEDLPLTPSLSVAGFEQGFVGDPGLVNSPVTSQGEMAFPFNAVTAKAVETLPDSYSFIGKRQHKFRLVRMELIRPLVGEFEPDCFYYLLPETYMTDLTKYDALVIHLMRQFSHAGSLLCNETNQQLEVSQYAVLGFYTHTSGSVIAAFTDGLFDQSLWFSTDVWTNEVGNNRSQPTDPTLEAYEQHIKDNYPEDYAEPIYERIEPISDEAVMALEYVEAFRNGVFISTMKLLATDRAYYRRYANGYPTNETVQISPDSASYSIYQFTSEDLKTLPDLASGLHTVGLAYDAGKITPPHLKGWEKMRLVRYVLFGWYEKTDSGIYAVIRVSWCYADDTQKDYDKKIHYDDQYYILEQGASICRGISHDELTKLINPKSNYLLGQYGYDDGGRILPPHRIYY